MKLNEMINGLPIKSLNDFDQNMDVTGVYIGDLLSFVMANGKEGSLWLTVQRHINVVAVAQLNDFSGIVFLQGVEPEKETFDKANELHIPLFMTDSDAFELARLLADKVV